MKNLFNSASACGNPAKFVWQNSNPEYNKQPENSEKEKNSVEYNFDELYTKEKKLEQSISEIREYYSEKLKNPFLKKLANDILNNAKIGNGLNLIEKKLSAISNINFFMTNGDKEYYKEIGGESLKMLKSGEDPISVSKKAEEMNKQYEKRYIISKISSILKDKDNADDNDKLKSELFGLYETGIKYYDEINVAEIIKNISSKNKNQNLEEIYNELKNEITLIIRGKFEFFGDEEKVEEFYKKVADGVIPSEALKALKEK